MTFVFFALTCVGLCEADPMRGPWETQTGNSTGKKQEETRGVADALIGFYQDYISGVGGPRCRMHPSCSAYGRECFGEHGFLKGFVMTSDRLMRCGRSETRLAPRLMIQGRIKYYDPVQANDFWWHEKVSACPLPSNENHKTD